MFSSINNILVAIDDFVWGIPLIVMILATGIFLTVRLKGLQISKLPLAFKYLLSNESDGKDGEISSFAALCTALSATIGTGNIVGVSTAIVAGGPGALFWMWVAAIFGTATKYAEGFLSIKYRTIAEDGHVVGGPFYYIENGMGKKWKWLGKIFAFFGLCVGLMGIGTFTQINGITNAVNNFFDANNVHTVSLLGRDYSWSVVIAGVILTLVVAFVIIGGIKRIASVSQVIVPFMAAAYILSALIILVLNFKAIPGALVEIIQGAFGIRAVAGGALGAMMVAMQKGIARGIFSNEAGLGSAPIAASAAKVDYAVQQGIISMTGTFFDTIVICTITGLTIVIGGILNPEILDPQKFQGFAITNAAFHALLPRIPDVVISFVLMACLVLFAFTTILGWDYYSERCIEYLSDGKMTPVKIYRWLYIAAIFSGPYMTVSAVWTIADIVNGLMAIPNIISLLVLNGIIVKLTADYFSGKRIYSIGYDFWNNPVADAEQN